MTKPFVAIITCKKYNETRGRWCRETWVKDLDKAGVDYKFIIGDPALQQDHLIKGDVLYLKVGDRYEDLVEKVFGLYRYIEQHTTYPGVFKVDDDVVVNVSHYKRVCEAVKDVHYGGDMVLNSNTSDYHISRVVDHQFKQPINTQWFGEYAAGSCYYVSRFFIEKLNIFSTHFNGYLAKQMLEDKTVGDLSRFVGIQNVSLPDFICNHYTHLRPKFIRDCFACTGLMDEKSFKQQYTQISATTPAPTTGNQLIPQIIHYFWEGSDELPEKVERMIKSWIRYNPNYVIKRWRYADLPKHPMLKSLYSKKKWSALSDFARLHAVYSEGGFYLDTDIELIRPLEQLRYFKYFMGVEGTPIAVNAAASGGIAGHLFVKMLIDTYLTFDYKRIMEAQNFAAAIGPDRITKIIKENFGPLREHHLYNVTQFGDVTLLPKRFFYPYNWNETFVPSCISASETFGIHYWDKSW